MSIIPKDKSIMHRIENNDLKKKQVFILKDIEKRKIVEHNDLITSVAKMDKTPLKIFELAVSYIDTENPPKDGFIYLSKTELFNFFRVSDSNKHSRFKEAIEKLQKQSYFKIQEEKGKGLKYKSIVPIPYIEWTDYNDEVKIEFHREIMPYLIDMKKSFTQYALSDLIELNSKYSIILYKWLSMYYNQYEHYSNKGGRREEQIESYRNPSITLEKLRIMTDTVEEYIRFTNFDEWVLKKPLEEINEHTHFNVSYEKIKKGRRVDSILFHITKKYIAPNTNYKQEQQDINFLEQKRNQFEKEKNLFAEAMQSKYTTLLLEKGLLSPYEMQEIKTMAGLQEVVYPLYDELKKLRDMDGVKMHLSYVSDKREGYTKRNIVRYLKMAIEDYLYKVKRQDIENGQSV